MRKTTLSYLSACVLLALQPATAAEETQQDINETFEVIVVTGTRTEQPLRDVAGSISVQTADDIEQQQVTDFSQLFRYDPSIQVTGRVGGAQNILVRGMGGNRVLMVKDGMRMNEGYGADGLNDIVGRGFLDTSTLKQVEVAKGASSSLYGSDALSGIVVFTTKDPEDYLRNNQNFGAEVGAGYSDISSQTNLSATLAARSGNFSHLLSGTARRGSEEQNFAGNRDPFDIDSNSILYKANYQLNADDRLSFSVDLWRQDTSGDRADGLLSYFRGLAQFGYNIAHEESNGRKETQAFRLNYRSQAERIWADYIDVTLYKNDSKQTDEEYALLDINAPMFNTFELRNMWQTGVFQQDSVGFLSSAAKTLNSTHRIAYGVDIEYTESQRDVIAYRTIEDSGEVILDETDTKFPKNEITRYGVFLNDTITLLDGRFQLTPGVRFDRFEMDPNGALKTDGTEFQPIKDDKLSLNVGAIYHLTPQVSVYAQYGQGFKVPAYDLAYIEHDLQPTSTYRYTLVPNEELLPEKSDTYELGLRGQIGNLAFNGAIYYNEFDNFLEVALIDSNTIFDDQGQFMYQHDIFNYHNIESVTIKGVEAGFTYYLGDAWSLFTSASYQHGKNDETDEYITSISPLSGVSGVRFEHESWNTQLIANWAQRMTKINEGQREAPGYTTLDWLTRYQLSDNLAVNLAVFNLLDKNYLNYNNVAGHAESADVTAMTQPGRTFNISARYRF